MNVYRQLNQLAEYIEENIEGELGPEVLSDFLHTNNYTAGKIFVALTSQSFSEYVRKRRLSLAGQDLYTQHSRIIDLAIKYGYSNATAFSRAFEKFHGVKPSKVNKATELKNFPRLVFNEDIKGIEPIKYEITKLPAMALFGVNVNTNNAKISRDAPKLFQRVIREYVPVYGPVKYGAISYEPTRQESQKYFCLWDREIPDFIQLKIPASKWLKFTINSQNADDIQEMSRRFYREFLPSSKYMLRELPELEYYHENITDFLVAIE